MRAVPERIGAGAVRHYRYTGRHDQAVRGINQDQPEDHSDPRRRSDRAGSDDRAIRQGEAMIEQYKYTLREKLLIACIIVGFAAPFVSWGWYALTEVLYGN